MAPRRAGAKVDSLSFLDSAAEILRRSRESLTAPEIVASAIRIGMLITSGKTPDRTMSAVLYKDVARHRNTRFVRLSKKGPHRAVRNSVRWALRKRALRQH